MQNASDMCNKTNIKSPFRCGKSWTGTFLFLCIFLFSSLTVCGQSTSELRFKYVETNLGLDKATFSKLAPTLKAYIRAMKEAGDIYDDVKDEYKSEIKNGKLTDRQAAELNKARLKSEAKELEVKRQYYTKFQALISEKYIFRLMKLASDKKSKFVPNKKHNDDEE